MTFDGKVVLVTGAGSGIGLAAALRFARDGARTFGLVRRATALEQVRAAHPEVRWLLGDVAKPTDARVALTTIAEQTGRLDVLVNNAAIFESGSLGDSSEPMIRRHFEINVFGLIFVTQAALPALLASRGAIVNISSVVGHKPSPNGSIYASTKAAVDSLTESWALELAPRGVRVNAISPGPTETPGLDKYAPAEVIPTLKAQLTAQVPLGRMASPDEVARWIVAVADPSASWLTGANLHVDGGMSLT